ncbi:hypothetical protein GQ457_18G019250 [Hibiscus cannabinus]
MMCCNWLLQHPWWFLGYRNDEQWTLTITDISNAFSTSLLAFLLINPIMYSIKAASQGKVICSLVASPNSSSDTSNNSITISFFRYSNGSTKRLLSELYTTK